MKKEDILLTSLNAKFIHSSLSIYSLKSYAKEYKENIKIVEYTINNDLDYILEDIYVRSPKFIGFSCYIWNIESTLELCNNLRKIMPDIKILLGGPEVSFDNDNEVFDCIDYIIYGEGEEAFYQLIKHIDGKLPIEKVPSLFYKEDGKIKITEKAQPMDLNDIPFPYEDITDFENRIMYYEASRGCPFNCQYCLSSIDGGLRFLKLDRVYEDLDFFLNNRVRQVKFVDRTFNAKKSYCFAIWEYIIKNDNGYTNFHFEISADLIGEDALELLKNARKGLIQFEIGVQSTNMEVLDRVDRKTDLDKIYEIVRKVMKYGNIHMHMDLIAGLPKEDIKSFEKSFDDVYALRPEQLQLGFLKLLKGSGLRNDAEELGIVYREKPTYEVLYTKELSFGELVLLKGVEDILEKFYNSGRFITSIEYLNTYFKPFELFKNMWLFYEKKEYHRLSHKKQFFYAFLLEYYNTFADDDIIKDFLIFDMFTNENVKNIDIKIKADNKMEIYKEEDFPHLEMEKSRIQRNTHKEKFRYDVLEFYNTGKLIEKETYVIFDYTNTKENNIGNAYVYNVAM